MPSLPPFPEHLTPAELEWRDGMPVSRAFDDVYFSREGGIAETQHVFVGGNRLGERFRENGLRSFTIGETGFGTGLNFLVAIRDFLDQAPAQAVLHYVSVEKFPLTPDDLGKSHAHWPSLANVSAELRAHWPPACSGFHHRRLFGGRVRLTLLSGDAAAMLPRLDARVDAWFLDGFAPAKNSELWNAALFAEIARLSAADATFATFTAAGDVRRGLMAAGFDVEKVAGFGKKREMLRGRRRAGTDGRAIRAHGALLQGSGKSGAFRIAVIGGGLAGCAVARAFADRGQDVVLIERNDRLADETSGNLAGAVYPKFSVHETPQNRWYRDSYLYALHRLPQVLGEPDGVAWSRSGLLQLPSEDNADRLRALADCGRWPATILRHVDAQEASTFCGIEQAQAGLWFDGAAWVSPPALCRALATHPAIRVRPGTRVLNIHHDGIQPVVDDEAFDIVVVANALAANSFAPTDWLPLRRVRGQVTHIRATAASRSLRAVVCHAGYITPACADGAGSEVHCIGATFSPHDTDPLVRDTDHAENLADLSRHCPALYDALGDTACEVVGGRTGFRTQSPDFLPQVGPVHDADAFRRDPATAPMPGLYVATALGAKGISFSLLAAEIIAAHALGEPCPVDSEVAAALAPVRFLKRTLRKAGKSSPQELPVHARDP